MTTELRHSRFSPSLWVPTLYFAEGLPFYAVNMMALIFYSRMGVSNVTITATVSVLATAVVAEAAVESLPGDVPDEEVLRCG